LRRGGEMKEERVSFGCLDLFGGLVAKHFTLRQKDTILIIRKIAKKEEEEQSP
jgi:hypothetical protein